MHGAKKNFLLQVISLLCLWPALLFGQSSSYPLSDEELLKKQNALQTDKSALKQFYYQYLNNKWYASRPSFAHYLLNAALLAEERDEALTILETYGSQSGSLSVKEQAFAFIAAIYEAQGSVDEALQYYAKAYEYSKPLNKEYQIRIGLLYLSSGEFTKAMSLAQTLLLKKDLTLTEKNQLFVLAFSTCYAASAIKTAENIYLTHKTFLQSKEASSALIYTLCLYYSRYHNTERLDFFTKQLKENYPNSLEQAIMDGKVKPMPSLIGVL